MRLHRLEITSFGPFAGTEHIDVDALAEHGLFLLNGPTGAGKTSILDAVCFALYGSLPGARQGSRALKSHHAAADAEPSVLLEFTAQGRRFEVRRTPEWSKPSRRAAGGWSVQKASTHLREHVDGEWAALSARNDEVGAVLADVLGMGREQFTRVVMLPQGEFASFLRSKAAERVALLEKLFGTQRYADAEEQLAHLAQAARGEAEQAERAAALPIAQLEAELAAAPAEGADHDADSTPQRPSRVEAESARSLFRAAERAYASQSAAAAEAQARAKTDLEAAREAAEAAARSLEDAEELARARTSRAVWEDAGPEHARHVAALAAHREAVGLRPHLAESERSAAEERRTVREALAALEDAQAAGWVPGASEEDGAGDALGLPSAGLVHRASAAASAEAAVLAERLPAERELEELEARHEREAAEARRLAEASARAAQDLGEATEHAEGLAASRAQLEPVAATLGLARVEADAARAVMEAVQEHAEAAPAASAAAEAHTRLRQESLDARERWLALRERRLDQSAAELAARLEPGAACPVCGSPEHPQPAHGAEEPLGLVDAERAAAQEAEAAVARERTANDAVAAARERLAAVDARGGATDPDKAARTLEEALSEFRHAEAASAELVAVLSRLEAAARRRDLAAVALADATAAQAGAEGSLARLASDARCRRDELAVWRAGYPSLAARQADVAARARTLDSLEQSVLRHGSAAASLERARVAFAEALAATPFADEAAVREALVPEQAARALEDAVRAHEAEGQQLGGLFDAAAVRRALEAESAGRAVRPEELAMLRAREAEAEARRSRGEVSAHAASAAEDRRRRLEAEFEACLPALASARDRADLLAELLRTVRGQGENAKRMSLHSYVLAARLEQVAHAATERLLAMTDGRFTLEHSDALAARGAASGLGLEVHDGWTGQRRDPSTLSGGESFMASLALALGLADVVQHESGGIDIETLFVDEGFGSLDEQSLEQVMDAIEGLRAGGRVVGLVSHVPELKQRIPAQIRVVKGRTGSHVNLVGVSGEPRREGSAPG
ncbi:AAA family ATPase [Sinomonas mesophila]|uniref:AAA family ATPase n=1 Tax=Sinomonas mesophila TaxID=1531955 RepID=UPI0009866029|nr:SMC family ATPase [Sinomonas mesophila]